MNMKKIVGFLMVALLALMALPANAQLKFGIKGGVNISSVHLTRSSLSRRSDSLLLSLIIVAKMVSETMRRLDKRPG